MKPKIYLIEALMYNSLKSKYIEVVSSVKFFQVQSIHFLSQQAGPITSEHWNLDVTGQSRTLELLFSSQLSTTFQTEYNPLDCNREPILPGLNKISLRRLLQHLKQWWRIHHPIIPGSISGGVTYTTLSTMVMSPVSPYSSLLSQLILGSIIPHPAC